jgi:very-long-chain (3R)-3-hydroxyacyl-CoA dehydratase
METRSRARKAGSGAVAAAPGISATTPPSRSSSAVTKNYLVAYNLVSAVLWAAVLGRSLLIVSVVGYQELYKGTLDFLRVTQSLALLEVVHSVLGKRFLFTMSSPNLSSN